jgi:hypothetical protein
MNSTARKNPAVASADHVTWCRRHDTANCLRESARNAFRHRAAELSAFRERRAAEFLGR